MITVNSVFTLKDGSQELEDNVESSGNSYLAVIDVVPRKFGSPRKITLRIFQDGSGEILVTSPNDLIRKFNTFWDSTD